MRGTGGDSRPFLRQEEPMAFTELQRPDRKSKTASAQQPDWTGFLAELTLLSEKYGIGIAGEAVCYAMEHDDYGFGYAVDDESRLARA